MAESTVRKTAKGARSSQDRELQRRTASSEDANLKRELDRRLDQALEDTFPASDPVSMVRK